MFSREAIDDVEVGGHSISEGTTIFISPWVQHRRGDLFPDPDRFDPDRFIDAAESRRPRYHYLPFGGGARVCVGQYFAMLEATLALASITQRATLEIVSDAKPEPLITLRAKDLRMRVRTAAL